jgi:two-component system, OmpR family, response regulator
MEILIVEDEPGIADFLNRGLASEGFGVRTASEGIAGEDLAIRGGFDLVILDRMLPGRDGIEVLAGIRRRRPDLPVIILTARDDVADRVEGLEGGATDYVTKPFSFDELLARVRAHLRQASAERPTVLEAGGIRLDLLSRTALRDGTSVRLPEREAGLLAHLMQHVGEVCTKQELLRSVWGYEHDPGTNVVQVYVGYLRRKLGSPDAPAPIETVRSVGYRLRDAT